MKNQEIILIAAAAENNAIGKNNELLWHLPLDFQHFKAITTGHYIVMGRKTFESFPKPLPNRTHIIITKNKQYSAPGCIVVHSLEEAIASVPKNEDIYIIGGAEIYKQSIKIATKLELTRVHDNFDADAFFPEINWSQWELTKSAFHSKDEKHNYDFTFQTFVKK